MEDDVHNIIKDNYPQMRPEMPVTARFSGAACNAPFGGRMREFDNCARVHKLISVHYRLNRNILETLVYARISHGWVGVGWGYHSMEQSNAVIAYRDPNGKPQIADYFLEYKGAKGVRPEGRQALTIKRVEASADSISAFFARPVHRIGNVPPLNSSSGSNPLIWAYGTKANLLGELNEHTGRGWTNVDFPNAGTIGSGVNTGIMGGFSLSLLGPFAIHGMLMSLAFVVLVPAALAVMRAKSRPKTSLRAHRFLNGAGLCCAAIGLVIAIINGAHTYHAHMAVGGFALVLAFLQPINYLRRPQPGSLHHGTWRRMHASAGRLAFLLAIGNIFIGLHIFMAHWISYALVGVFLFGFCVLALMLRRGLEHQLLPGEEEIIDEDAVERTAAQLIADNAELASEMSRMRAAFNTRTAGGLGSNSKQAGGSATVTTTETEILVDTSAD